MNKETIDVESKTEETPVKKYIDAGLLNEVQTKIDQVIGQVDQTLDQLNKQLAQLNNQKMALIGQKSLSTDLLAQSKTMQELDN